jgi:hypothetical protein
MTGASDKGPRGNGLEVALAGIVYTAVTLALFRTLLPTVTTHLFGDLGDPLLNTAILAWNATVVPLTDPWWNFPTFAPLSGVTAWTEHLLGVYPLTTPIIWTTGNAVLAYNVVQLVSPPLNGLCAFLLVREVTGSATGAFVGGLAFAFAPFHGEHVTHIQLETIYGMPLALYGLHLYLRTGARTALAWFAVGWLSALLSSAYLLIFFSILLVLWCAWFLRSRSLRTWTSVAGTALVTALPVVPLVLGYYTRQRAYAFARPYDEVKSFAASVVSLTGISHRSVLWKGVLPDHFNEASLFPGLCVVVLIGLALMARGEDASDQRAGNHASRYACVLFYFVATVVMWALALGPELTWAGGSSSIHGPYWLLQQLPGGQTIRVPARAWVVATLCLSVCAGAGAAYATRRLRSLWILLPITLAIVGEGWFVADTFEVPPVSRELRLPEGAVVLDLPLYEGYENAVPQYLAVMSGYRVLNGYSGYAAPHFGPLRDALAAHRYTALDAFRRRGDLYAIVRHSVDPAVVEWLESEAELLDANGGRRLYRLPRLGDAPRRMALAPLPRNGEIVFMAR